MIKDLILEKIHLFRELIVYVIIGGIAFSVHFSIVFSLVHFLDMAPLVANAVAFMLSFNVSFWGHHYFTFAGHETEIKHAMRRLFTLASINFFVSEYFYYILLHSFHINYLLALVINVGIIAFVSFLISKFWVFKTAW